MATMHSRRRGQSASRRPAERTVPEWTRYKASEVELIIAKLSKEGKSSSQIGIILRDTYGIPDVKALLSKSVTTVLKERKLYGEVPEDLMNLIKKSVQVKTHLEENRQDKVSKRGLALIESKIRRLVKYYKANDYLSADWTYDPEKIKLLIQ